MSERNSIRFGDTTIEYQVRRSERRKKTVQITVDGGGVQVAAPLSIPADELRALVKKRAPWILSHASEGILEATPKRFVSGETLPYLGRNVRMVVESGNVRSPEVRFDHWRLGLVIPEGISDGKRFNSVRQAIIGWYRVRAKERLTACTDWWWSQLGSGVRPAVLIRDQRQRWGSCAPDGTLRFNWRAVMLKPTLAEYVVVHELVHLTHRNHSKDFWAAMSSVLPDVQQRRKALREAGRMLPL